METSFHFLLAYMTKFIQEKATVGSKNRNPVMTENDCFETLEVLINCAKAPFFLKKKTEVKYGFPTL